MFAHSNRANWLAPEEEEEERHTVKWGRLVRARETRPIE